jgi:hypothetical protein
MDQNTSTPTTSAQLETFLRHVFLSARKSKVQSRRISNLPMSTSMHACAVSACMQIVDFYSDAHKVFSERSGFQIYVLDFDVRDWARKNYRNLIKTHEVAPFKFSKLISLQTYSCMQ